MKKSLLLALSLSTLLTVHAENTTSDYSEKWRPQYHFTPAHRWIGDPCGLIHYQGKFHAYSWGSAESDDLLHWTEINKDAIKNIPNGIAPFTGSVVVDKNNSAGYGNDTFIAAFTSFDENSKKQSQSIAFSLDNGRTFQYYDLNPVIDTWSTEFRDPTVIWDEKNGRWVMLVAKALEKKIAFYASTDLKHWSWLSDFGPYGDCEKSWECPDMFQTVIEGSDKKKWVLVISVNWAREQYFTGEFDGTRFIPDNPGQEAQYVDEGLDYYASRTFQDYDGSLPAPCSIGWVSTWDYAQHVPTQYGKGVWSMPRELSLKESTNGLKLIQRPHPCFKSLRGKGHSFSRKLKPGSTSLPSVSRMKNQYEITADFSTDSNDIFGLKLCSGNEQHVTLTYDAKSETLLLDRTNASEQKLPKFERIAFAKVPPVNNRLSLNIFVDKSVVEIYANDGECVMTALTFPSENAIEAELFSIYGNTYVDLRAYPMSSIWH